IADPSANYDLALISARPAWPGGYRLLQELFSATADGGLDASRLDDPAITAEFDRVERLTAAGQINAASVLDQKIMAGSAPVVPLYYGQTDQPHGSRVANAPLSPVWGLPDLSTASVS